MGFKVGCFICVTYEETASQFGCFAHFCHNCVATVGAHAYISLYFVSKWDKEKFEKIYNFYICKYNQE